MTEIHKNKIDTVPILTADSPGEGDGNKAGSESAVLRTRGRDVQVILGRGKPESKTVGQRQASRQNSKSGPALEPDSN